MARRYGVNLVAAVLCVLLLGTLGWTQEKPVPPTSEPEKAKIPPEAAERKNPVAADAESVAMGKRLYASQCALCHGESGDGKGELAAEIGLKTPDFRHPEKMGERTDGALFYLLSEGHQDMPPQGKRLTETQRWHLVNYIRSLARKEKPASNQPRPR